MRAILAAAAVAGFAGVASGAASTHLASGDPEAQRLIDIASRYLLVHAAVLTGVSAIDSQLRSKLVLLAAALMALGVGFFSSGLVALALTGWRVASLATPIGGTTLMAGWLTLGIAGLKLPRG